jgi:inulin fructotransferase (DFA-I-forming)
MVVLAANSSENLVASNHLLRDHEPWTPFLEVNNGMDDLYGLLRVSGYDNSIIGNHFSEVIDPHSIRPSGATPVVIRLTAGSGNYVASNHMVGKTVPATSSGSAFEAQVDALLMTEASDDLPVTAVLVDPESARNTILDSGTDTQVVANRATNAVRATPAVGS